MKIVLFTIVNWDTQKEADDLKKIFEEWDKRKNYFHPDYSFIVCGSYSNPKYNPIPKYPLLQTHIDKQFYPDQPINYWKCGFLCGLHHCIYKLDSIDWDIVVYYHYCVLNSIDFNPIYSKFIESDKSICGLTRLTSYGNVLDTGLMVMKLSGVQKWLLNCLPGAAYDRYGNTITIEREADSIFKNDIYNPFPNIVSMHRFHSGGHPIKERPFEKRFDLTHDEFIKNPIIFGYKHHCPYHELMQWKLEHPINC